MLKLKFIYFRIPKTTNSTMTAMLQMSIPSANTTQEAKRAGRQLGCNGIWTARRLEQQFTFTFIRKA
jgi:hypothetical protein